VERLREHETEQARLKLRLASAGRFTVVYLILQKTCGQCMEGKRHLQEGQEPFAQRETKDSGAFGSSPNLGPPPLHQG
jgi:hypothetical protein